MQLPTRAKSTSRQAAAPSVAARLAPEVLLLILTQLRSPAADMAIRSSGDIPRVDKALAVCPRICRVWSVAATHELYFSVALPTVEACARFLRTLKANPALGARVRRIALPLCSTCGSRSSARHSRTRCRAADIFSEILVRLPSLKAARVQDTHVSARAIYSALSRVQELTIDNGYSPCAASRHPQLLHAGSSMPNIRRLNLIGSPWELPAPADGAGYCFPKLRVLSMAGIDASADDIQFLLNATTTLRVLELDSVRAFVGPCSACSVVPLAVLTAPLSATLETLRLRHMTYAWCSDSVPNVQHLEVDSSFRRIYTALPPSLKTFTLLVSETDAFETEPEDALELFARDPFHITSELLAWLARSTSPVLSSVAIHVASESRESLQAWRHAEAILAKSWRESAISLEVTISQECRPVALAPEERKIPTKTTPTCGNTWLRRRRVFHHMRKLLRAL